MAAERNCEFCGCHTNANVRACCRRGKDADLRRIIEEADAAIAARQPEREPHYLRPVQASLLPTDSGCERGRGSVMACGSSPMCGCPAALAELERNPDAFGVALRDGSKHG